MSDTGENTPASESPDEQVPDNSASKLEAEAAKWKELARKHEARAKENAEAAKRLAELEDSGKSDLERLTAQMKAESDRADKAEARALRLEVAATKGLTPTQAKRLVGTTQEELEADADELLASFKPGTGDGSAADSGDSGGDTPTGRPQEKLRGGSASDDGEALVIDPAKLMETLPRP
jgi:hypothetical protein